jgi:hypothetical protein
MSLLEQIRFVERQQFFNGQRLLASDLQELEGFNREMRWLHNQSLHQPGIGNGFSVAGRKGAREVVTGPGYAIDCDGHEIVLTETWTEPVPAVAGDSEGRPVLFDLTVSYPEDQDLESAETRRGVCHPADTVRRREEPIFCWVRLHRYETGQLTVADLTAGEQVRRGQRIVVARAEVLNCQLNRDISVAQRRSARPPRQPFIDCGTVCPVDWQVWWSIDRAGLQDELLTAIEEGAQPEEGSFLVYQFAHFVGVQALIDTSAVGFLSTPCYTARIAGARIHAGYFIDGFVCVSEPQPTGFVVQVLWDIKSLEGDDGVQPIDMEVEKELWIHVKEAHETGADFLPCIQDYLNKVEACGLRLIPEDWHVVWMGVEG